MFKTATSVPRNVHICAWEELAHGKHTALESFFEEMYNNNITHSCVISGTGMGHQGQFQSPNFTIIYFL